MDIREPFSEGVYQDYTVSADVISAVVNQVGPDQVHSIIAYNYPWKGFKSLLMSYNSSNIKIIADCTEWYGWEGMGFARDLLRVLQTELRMRFYVPKSSGIICASQYLVNFYKNKNTFVWPFCLHDKHYFEPFISDIADKNERVFIYCGNPGVKIRKDLLNILVNAFYQVSLKGEAFQFKVVGISLEQYLANFPEDERQILALGKMIRFYGRKTREESLNLLASSHYSIFVRPNNRVSNVGFATKIFEAFCCGVPTITNDTSDNAVYIQDGINGYVTGSNDVTTLKEKIVSAIHLGGIEYEVMRGACRSNNPFDGARYAKKLKYFIDSSTNFGKTL
jgi:glycosyltransferase involved in cell wall biosynthesis